MTPVKVVDASAIAAILFAEPEGEAVSERLAGSQLVAPELLAFELASTCLKKARRDPTQQTLLLNALSRRKQLSIETVAVDHAGVVTLAAVTRLSSYDASYLWLSRELGAQLVTLDGRLVEAAASLGLDDGSGMAEADV